MWLVVALVVSCKGSPRPPDPMPAEQQLRAWLAVFNEADRAKLEAYHQSRFPQSAFEQPAMTLDEELEFRAGTSGFVIRKVEEATATKATVVFQERDSDQFARCTMEVEPAEPHKVVHFTIAAIRTPDELRVKRMTEAAAIAALKAELDRRVAADQFAGAVIVARHGTPVFAQAYGLADRARKLPNTLDTKFRIGSMNKMFTATAIVQLVQDGTIALTTTLGKIRPAYPNANLAAKVTIQHLLTHTGGTGDIFGPEFDKHRLELKTHDDYVRLYGARDLAYEPGLRWQYSNYGFVLLGAILESLSGQTYYDRVEARVFRPAGMTSSGSPPEDQPDPARAVGYLRERPTAPWTPNTDTLPYRGTSAGGGLSTVHDLLRFANALQGHTLLDEAHTRLLTTGKVDTPGGARYAFGFSDETDDGVRCVGHGGGAPGMNGALAICDSGYTIAVLSNLDPPAADRIARFVKLRLPAR
jgi:CubicO group peptidase (beta-lactamase class C family)